MPNITSTIFISQALQNLRPNSGFSFDGTDLLSIKWTDPTITAPTLDEIRSEYQRIEDEFNYKEYQRLRAAAYPPIEDYLDAVVKNDQSQIDAYIAACLAVKQQYPKP
jgi:hypothetical protein